MTSLEASRALRNANQALNAGDPFNAERFAKIALQSNPRDAEAMFLIGRCNLDRGRFEEAESWARKASRVQPKDPRHVCLLAASFTPRSRLREAMQCYERAAKLDAAYPRAAVGRAEIFLLQGKPEKARDVLLPLVQSGRAAGDVLVAHVRAEQALDEHDAVIDLVRRYLADANLHPLHRGELLLAIGRSLDKLKRYDEAFEAYHRGNELVAPPFDFEADRQMHEQIARLFSADAMARHQRSSSEEELPVFIVGMPRSGSTLIEQIIHAHPQAHGAGEIADLRAILHDVQATTGVDDPYPQCAAWLSSAQLNMLAAAYVAALRRHNRSALRIVDKNLNNYELLGMIAMMLPRARVIHSVREPLDTCVSCFTQRFMGAMHGYAYDLGNLGRHYRLYHDLMENWRAVLPLSMLEVRYEELVADLDTHARRIIGFCGLPWDDRCLRFHEAKRDVTTMSYDQVRRPIYGSSVGRWRRFAAHLGPLVEAIGVLPESGYNP